MESQQVSVAKILLPGRPEVCAMTLEMAAARVRAEFDEMPGMTLTVPQAARLFGLDQNLCRVIVEKLVTIEYLRRSGPDAFKRRVQ
jgi:hypothetical protein